MNAPLYGLVLAGGHSRRMRRDKALLPYAGKPQLARALELIAPFVQRRFVSIRADQADDPQRRACDTIADIIPDFGPIGGIHAALHAHPQHAWLVLACDLPFLDAATLQYLLQHRDDTRVATAYRSSHDALPEPLCAVFEPRSRAGIDAWIAQRQRCPRGFLAQADTCLLDLPCAQALDNINTAEEYVAASTAITPAATAAPVAAGTAGTAGAPGTAAHAARRRFHVQYFALLREQAGRAQEEVDSRARTPQELYDELRARRGLTLEPKFLRVAVNEAFGDWQQQLVEGDRIVFLPPVAGG